MLKNYFECPKCKGKDTFVWREVYVPHAEKEVKDYLQMVQVVCDCCGEIVCYPTATIVKKV